MSGNGKQAIEKPEVQVLAPPAEPTHGSIIELAVRQGANVETLARLLELKERHEANEARKAFDTAFAEFKKEAPKLERTKDVSHDGGKTSKYKYTPLDAIANTLAPILSKHGLSYNWTQVADKETIAVTCILRHTQGHSIENSLAASPDSSGSKNAIQAIGSAVSYLRRYTLLGVLGMATSDEDTDGVTLNNAADFVSNMESATTIEELNKRYREAQKVAYEAKDFKAAALFEQARKKYDAKLRAA